MTDDNTQDEGTDAKNIAPAVYNDGIFDICVDKDDDLNMAAIGCIHCGRSIFTFSQYAWPTAILKMTCPLCGHITYFHLGAGIMSGKPFPPLPSPDKE